MGLRKQVFRSDDTSPRGSGRFPAPTRSAPVPVSSDRELLQECLRMLAAYNFLPRREITRDDLLSVPVTGVVEFRRRPLTTLLMLRGRSGELLFPHVFVDDEWGRISVLDMKHFIREVAARAGTADQLGEIHFRTDPGSDNTGILQYTLRMEVRGHSFRIDPYFGDRELEAAIIEAVAPAGHRVVDLLMGLGQQPVTLWLPQDADDHLVENIHAENRHRHWGRATG
ncbi:hypothetical protein [Corynebacterium halotolerans]|nr:hypothetical protein [Corynebacterium halotolerans]